MSEPRFSDQFRLWRRSYAHAPPLVPRGTICWSMRQTRGVGTVKERIEVVLTPEQCVRFGIFEPQWLSRRRVATIMAWGARR